MYAIMTGLNGNTRIIYEYIVLSAAYTVAA